MGAHEETHNMTINGHKWLHHPGTPQDPLAVNNSGYRNSQMAGISEHFEFITGKESILGTRPFINYLYQNSASVDGQWNGIWGIFRVYYGRSGGIQTDLQTLPNNLEVAAPLTTNDTSFAPDATFKTGATDFRDEATSTAPTAMLRVYVTGSGALMGTLSNNGGGSFSGYLSWPNRPKSITVRSNFGGSASRLVTLR